MMLFVAKPKYPAGFRRWIPAGYFYEFSPLIRLEGNVLLLGTMPFPFWQTELQGDIYLLPGTPDRKRRGMFYVEEIIAVFVRGELVQSLPLSH